MELADLEIFRAVAREGSVTRAADMLDRVPSNVTTRVRQLEADLGVALFSRAGKRMTLTADGETLLAYAHRLLSLATEARDALSHHEPSGRLRIGTMESTAASRLPPVLAAFHGRWPKVAVELSTGTSRRLADDVSAHALDCAFVASIPGSEGFDFAALPGLTARPVFTEDLLLVLPQDHPVLTGPADIRVPTLAALPRGCTYRWLAGRWMAGGAPPAILELASYHAILACVAAGGCMGVVPRSVLETMSGTAELRTFSLGPVETLFIRRADHRSSALDALAASLPPGNGAGGPA